jgi:hypothetical protein
MEINHFVIQSRPIQHAIYYFDEVAIPRDEPTFLQ